MVNFSERLKRQLIPEWKHAFCEYDELKRDIENLRAPSRTFSLSSDASLHSKSFHAPSFRHVGSLARRTSTRIRNADVKVHLRHPLAENVDEELYETELLTDYPHGELENEKDFFSKLDGQLNKVNQFYKKKEQELYEKAEEINEQLEKLVALRKLLKEKQDPSSSKSSSEKGSGNGQPDSVTMNIEASSTGEKKVTMEECARISNKHAHSPAVDFGLVIPQDTPSLLIGALKQKLTDDIFNTSRQPGEVLVTNLNRFDLKRIQYAEKSLREACQELHRGLGYLRSFSSLNMTAFSKILKKYDKRTGRNVSLVYMRVVENAYFYTSDKVLKMMDGLEKRFIEIFAHGNRKRAMALLRPARKPASHKVTFFLGLFAGYSSACLVAFITILHLKWGQDSDVALDTAKHLYLRAIYPLFSILAMVLLHLGLYGWNLYSWRENQINYAFIFGLPPGTEIKYRELLLITMALATIVAAILLGHFMIYTISTASFRTAIMPFTILVAFLMLLICPFNICYRSTRLYFLNCLRRVTLAPFYKVVMVDFFLADQLTSQVYMFRNVEYVLCYSIFGRFKEENIDSCTGHNWNFLLFAYVVSMIPYWWRFAQCIRRWIDERSLEHMANGAKYFSALVAAGIALTYNYHKTQAWLVIFVVFTTLATGYQLYWDICKDWGLLRTKSKNYLLRDQLMLNNKNLYYASMALNTILRFAWLQSVTQIEFFGIDRRLSDWFFASLEVVRRVHWNFYRLENEHLNNVGHFRATKAIPLPFTDDSDAD